MKTKAFNLRFNIARAPLKKRKKKLIAAFIIIIAIFIAFTSFQSILAAGDNADAEADLSDTVKEQLNSLDLTGLEAYLNSLTGDDYALFGGMSFKEKVSGIINGDFKIGYDSFFSAILNLTFKQLLSYLPAFLTIIAVAILSTLLNGAKGKTAATGVEKIIHFACMSVVVIITAAVITQLVLLTRNTVTALQRQMNMIFPILLTIMTALGGTASVAVYQPAVAVLSQLVSGIMVNVILPIFIFTFVFNIIGSLGDGIKTEKFSGFFSGLSKWVIGIVFTVFTAFLSIQGITAGTHDKISIRTAKYAISHYVPIIGGYLSEGFNLIMAGSVLIKNAIGFLGVLLLLISILSPVITILIFSLGLKLTAAVLEPVDGGKISGFLTAAGKSLTMLIVIILAVAFMYLITLMLIVCTGNTLMV